MPALRICHMQLLLCERNSVFSLDTRTQMRKMLMLQVLEETGEALPRHSVALHGQVIKALFREELRSGGQTWSSNHSSVISPQDTSCNYYKDEVLLFFFFF